MLIPAIAAMQMLARMVLAGSAAPPAGGTVLVVPLVPTAGVTAEQAGMVTALLTAEVGRLQGVQVVALRDVQDRLTPEQVGLAATCAAVKCAQELATVVGAQEVVLGELGRLGHSTLLSLMRVDVARGEVVARQTARAEGKSVEAILDEVPDAARILLGGTGGNTDREGGDGATEEMSDGKPGWTLARVAALTMRITGVGCCISAVLPLLVGVGILVVGIVTSAIFASVIGNASPLYLGIPPSAAAAGLVALLLVVPAGLGITLLVASFFVN